MAASRPAYTLFELMLVMAVLVLAASITIPVISALRNPHLARAAADMVRARWADMRNRAMQEGRAYKFSVVENTGRFKIEPEEEAEGDGEEAPWIFEGELPEGVIFAKSPEPAPEGVDPTPGVQFETVAVYLPEGIARDDVVIYFGKDGGHSVGLRLRSLTGAVTTIDPRLEMQP